MPATQSRIKKILRSIQDVFSLHICIKRKSSEVKETDEKLLKIFNELTVGISEVFEEKPQAFDEYLRCDKVSCKISVLNEQIGQVQILYSLWKNGYDLNPQELVAKLQSLNLLVDCIRDDVFYAYLRLPPEQKLHLLKNNKQVSAIFAVLGALENEVSKMLKTVFPNDELMKAVKPLLKPNFSRFTYKRQAKNFYSYDPPAYQTVQFSCKKVTYKKPKLVDAWTDPINQRDWDQYDDHIKSIKSSAKYLEPVHRSHSSENHSNLEQLVSCANTENSDSHDDFLIMENTVTLTKLESNDRVSIDRLSFVTNDINDVTGAQHSFLPRQEALNCSQECLRENSYKSPQELNLWKIAAAELLAHPSD